MVKAALIQLRLNHFVAKSPLDEGSLPQYR